MKSTVRKRIHCKNLGSLQFVGKIFLFSSVDRHVLFLRSQHAFLKLFSNRWRRHKSERKYQQWRIQDFPQGGAPTPKIAIIFQIFAENCMKMKEFGPPGGGARPWRPPLDPPMIRSLRYCVHQIFCTHQLCQ